MTNLWQSTYYKGDEPKKEFKIKSVKRNEEQGKEFKIQTKKVQIQGEILWKIKQQEGHSDKIQKSFV